MSERSEGEAIVKIGELDASQVAEFETYYDRLYQYSRSHLGDLPAIETDVGKWELEFQSNPEDGGSKLVQATYRSRGFLPVPPIESGHVECDVNTVVVFGTGCFDRFEGTHSIEIPFQLDADVFIWPDYDGLPGYSEDAYIERAFIPVNVSSDIILDPSYWDLDPGPMLEHLDVQLRRVNQFLSYLEGAFDE